MPKSRVLHWVSLRPKYHPGFSKDITKVMMGPLEQLEMTCGGIPFRELATWQDAYLCRTVEVQRPAANAVRTESDKKKPAAASASAQTWTVGSLLIFFMFGAACFGGMAVVAGASLGIAMLVGAVGGVGSVVAAMNDERITKALNESSLDDHGRRMPAAARPATVSAPGHSMEKCCGRKGCDICTPDGCSFYRHCIESQRYRRGSECPHVGIHRWFRETDQHYRTYLTPRLPMLRQLQMDRDAYAAWIEDAARTFDRLDAATYEALERKALERKGAIERAIVEFFNEFEAYQDRYWGLHDRYAALERDSAAVKAAAELTDQVFPAQYRETADLAPQLAMLQAGQSIREELEHLERDAESFAVQEHVKIAVGPAADGAPETEPIRNDDVRYRVADSETAKTEAEANEGSVSVRRPTTKS